MKVLKSGIEIDPSDLSNVKGGACACGCPVGINGDFQHITGRSGKACSCYCVGMDLGEPDAGEDVENYIN